MRAIVILLLSLFHAHAKGSYTCGKVELANGDVFEGEFFNGNAHGKGTLHFANGNVYSGDFVDGKIHGQGTKTYADGDAYTGEFVSGVRHGKGTFKFFSGEVYTGEFANDVRHGKGTFKSADGDMYYEGEWKADKRDGKGTETYADGEVYTGEFVNDVRHGNGTFKWAAGGIHYEGEWKDHKRDGRGKITYAHGSWYEGEWKDDKRNGEGKLTGARGQVYEGEWKAGILDGDGAYTHTYDIVSIVDEGVWKDGKGHRKSLNFIWKFGLLKEGLVNLLNHAGGVLGVWMKGTFNLLQYSLEEVKGVLAQPSFILAVGNFCLGVVTLVFIVKMRSDSLKSSTMDTRNSSNESRANLIHGPPSRHLRVDEVVGAVTLDEELKQCTICYQDFSFDRNTDNEDARNHLPVLSRTCQHWYCQGCILRFQAAKARDELFGRAPEWISCFGCNTEENAFCAAQPNYYRLLIDLLGRSVQADEERNN